MKGSRSQRGRSGESLEHWMKVVATGEKVVTGRRGLERRAKSRVNQPFPARIWGVDSDDFPFNMDCLLDNISSTGLYLRLSRELVPGCEVRLIVHLLSGPTTGATAVISGDVLRDEPQRDGSHGVAVAIRSYRFP